MVSHPLGVEGVEAVPLLETPQQSPRLSMTMDAEGGLFDVKDQKTGNGGNILSNVFVSWMQTPCNLTGRVTLEALRPQHVSGTIWRILVWLIPSFLRSGTERRVTLHETAYLDGVRGVACYIVFCSHAVHGFTNSHMHSWGDAKEAYQFWHLPFFRVFLNGQVGVAVFFVLSGYVLSYKPLKLIHARDTVRLQKNLASAIFKRWWRLFLPCLAVFILNLFVTHFGAYDWIDAYKIANPGRPGGLLEDHPLHGATFWETLGTQWNEWWDLVRNTLFNWRGSGFGPKTDGHMWTLHTEFRSSNLLFLFLHLTSFMKHNVRITIFLLSALGCWYCNGWAIATFLVGSVIADFDLRRRKRDAQKAHEGNDFDSLPAFRSVGLLSYKQGWFRRNSSQILNFGIFILAMGFLSFPKLSPKGLFPYDVLYNLTPKGQWVIMFWYTPGAILLVYSAGRTRCLQTFFEHPITQYMGKTSFSLYLMHGTVIRTLGYWIVVQTWAHITGREGFGKFLGIVVPIFGVVLPVTIVVSDWFWRGIDIPSTKLIRYFEGLLTDKSV